MERQRVCGTAIALMLEYQKSVNRSATHSLPAGYGEDLRAQRLANSNVTTSQSSVLARSNYFQSVGAPRGERPSLTHGLREALSGGRFLAAQGQETAQRFRSSSAGQVPQIPEQGT
jgi:hypothetical protein